MNIIVNGGSTGIGREVVLLMAKEMKNNILVTGRNEERLKSLAAECPSEKVTYLKVDITTLGKDINNSKYQIYNTFETIDVLINMAGLLIVKDFINISEKDSYDMMETNFFGPANLIRLLVPKMTSGSHIVNISSMGGYQGSVKYPGMAYYSASKAALSCLTECLAVELKEMDIRVNCLSLGAVQTDMFKSAFPGYKAPVSPEKMAEFIEYFAIEGGKFFNGRILPVALSNP